MDDESRAQINIAVGKWIDVRREQALKSGASGRAQEGRRSSVTGGLHLDGFNTLVVDEIGRTGADGLEMRMNRGATVPGYFRSSKSWDLLVLQHGEPVLAVEYKSMSGSEGKNMNNRADEVFGMAADARAAEEFGILPRNLRRAYIFVMAATEDSLRPVKVGRMVGNPDPVFEGASYMERMAIMCERVRDQGLYHLAWALSVDESDYTWTEPSANVGWERFAHDLREGFAGGQPSPPPTP